MVAVVEFTSHGGWTTSNQLRCKDGEYAWIIVVATMVTLDIVSNTTVTTMFNLKHQKEHLRNNNPCNYATVEYDLDEQ